MKLFHGTIIDAHGDVEISLVPLLSNDQGSPRESEGSTELDFEGNELIATHSSELRGALSTGDDPSMLCVSPYSYQTEFIGD